MMINEQFTARCRANLMDVETSIVKTYTSLLSNQQPFTAIDGGAHVGYHTERLAKLPNCNLVIAVEADPWTVLRLQKKIVSLDDDTRPKIRIVQNALQEDQYRDNVTWMSSSSHPGRSGVSSIWQADTTVTFRERMDVAATTIDKLAANAERPTAMIKLDLEGGDFMALRGAEATMRRDRPLVVFENSNRAPGIYGFSIHDMLQYFDSAGYVPVTFFGDAATESTWFKFWEMWAAPKEVAEGLSKRLREVVGEIMAS
jgi:FkbM family methyltransferase